MSIDFIGTVIFAIFALLVFRYNFTIKVTVFVGVIAAILPLLLTKTLVYLPYLISEMPMTLALSPAEIAILLLRLPVTLLVLLMIRKDTESLSRFGIWVAIGIFVNDMLLPFIIH